MVMGMDMLRKYGIDIMLSNQLLKITSLGINIPIYVYSKPQDSSDEYNCQVVSLNMMRTDSVDLQEVKDEMNLSAEDLILRKQNELCNKILRSRGILADERPEELTGPKLKTVVLNKTRKICENNMVILPGNMRANIDKTRDNDYLSSDKDEEIITVDDCNNNVTELKSVKTELVSRDTGFQILRDISIDASEMERVKLNSPLFLKPLEDELSARTSIENRKRKREMESTMHHWESESGDEAEPAERRCAKRCAVGDRGDELKPANVLVSRQRYTEVTTSKEAAINPDMEDELERTRAEQAELQEKLLEVQTETNEQIKLLIAEATRTLERVKARKLIQEKYNAACLKDVQKAYQAAVKRNIEGISLSKKGKRTTATKPKGKAESEKTAVQEGGQETQLTDDMCPMVKLNRIRTRSQDSTLGDEILPTKEEKEASPTKELEHMQASPTKELEYKEASPTKELEHKEASPTKELEHEEASPTKELEHEEASPTKKFEHEEASSSEELEHQEPEQEPEYIQRDNPRYQLRRIPVKPKVLSMEILDKADHVILQENRVTPLKIRVKDRPPWDSRI
ncbi:muscle M-line assembly protein unc-89-like [Cephus cinctus]|uniref:Muscle M-line assembly protein unc-89-like n=1 Tax=Cephus cinctus TaxID=211228 RepID=A0AAJ7W389_CEPCN|nr:muscle M-line assembly protein unc-89-like [Cephus cinctus]